MKRTVLILLIIFFLGLSLRMYYFLKYIPFTADTARDLLVGFHIARYGETLSVGHAASGNLFYSHYPPQYYYFHGLLNHLTTNPLLLLSFFVIWQSTSHLLIFLITRELFGNLSAFLAALMFTVSEYAIKTHTWMYSAPLAVPIFLISLYILLLALKRKNVYILQFAFSFLLIASLASYTVLPFILAFLVIVFFYFPAQRRIAALGLSIVWICLYTIFLYFPLLQRFGVQVLSTFALQEHFQLNTLFLPTLFKNFFLYLSTFFQGHSVTVFIVLSWGILAMTLNTIRHKIPEYLHYMKIICFIVFLILFFLLVVTLKHGFFGLYYFENIIPLLPIVTGTMFVLAFKSTTRTIIKISLILSYVVILVYVSGGFQFFKNQDNDFLRFENITKEILASAKTIASSNSRSDFLFFRAFVYEPNFGSWKSTVLWYFLEKMTGEKRLQLIEGDTNLVQTTTDEVVFLLCEAYPEEKSTLVCLSDFFRDYGQYELVRQIHVTSIDKIFVLKSQTSLIKV